MTKYIRVQNTHYSWRCFNCKKEFKFKCERASNLKQKLHGNKCIGKPIEIVRKRERTTVTVYHA